MLTPQQKVVVEISFAPAVTSETASPTSQDLSVGKTVTFTVNTTENVTATGSTLTLNNGAVAKLASGDGTSALVYSYTVAPGQDTPDLQATAINGTITDSSGFALDTASFKILDTKAIVDTTAPTGGGGQSDGATTKVATDFLEVLPEDPNGQNGATGSGVASVQLFDNGAVIGAPVTRADANGFYEFFASNLGAGSNAFTAIVTDKAGNQSGPIHLGSTLVDLTPPTGTGSQSDGAISNVTTDTLTVQAQDPNGQNGTTGSGVASVQFFDNGAAIGAPVTTADKTSGNYVFTATGLGEGSNAFTAVVTDNAGNSSDPIDLGSVLVDLTAPTGTGSQSDGDFSKMTTDTLTVTAQDNTQEKLAPSVAPAPKASPSALNLIAANGTTGSGVASVQFFDNGKAIGDPVTTADKRSGNYVFTATGLSEGANAFTAVVTDNAGNSSDPIDLGSVLTDTTAPTGTGLQSDGATTHVTADTLAVTAQDPTGANGTTGSGVAFVQFYDNDVAIGGPVTSVDQDGNYVFTANGLAEGANAFTAIVTDNAGNQSSSVAVGSTLVDQTAPTGSGSQSDGAATNARTDVLTFAAQDPDAADGATGSGVASVLFIDNGIAIGDPITNVDLNGDYIDTATGLSEGMNDFTAIVIDNAGNGSEPIDLGSTLVDATAPTGTGSQSDGPFANVTTDTLTVQAQDPDANGQTGSGVASVQFFDNGAAIGAPVTTEDKRSGNYVFTATGLSEGSNAFTAVVTDNAGNSSDPIDLGSTLVDLTAPTGTGSQSDGDFSNVTTDTLTVTAQDNTQKKPVAPAPKAPPSALNLIAANGTTGSGVASVQFFDNGKAIGDPVTTADKQSGNYVFTATGLSEGGNAFTAVVTDNAGNSSDPIDLGSVLTDTTAPTGTGSQSDGPTTKSSTDTLTVAAQDPNGANQAIGSGVASVQFFDNGAAIGDPVTSLTDGQYVFTATGLGEGINAFTAIVADNAGNSSGPIDLGATLVDTTVSTGSGSVGLPSGGGTGSGTATVSSQDPTSQLVERLYFAVLDRPADPAGLASFDQLYNARPDGKTLRHIASDLIDSQEFHSIHGSPSNRDFVEALYDGALGRPTEASALHHDVAALHNGLSRSALTVTVAESPEAMSHLAGNAIA